ncbi:WhiB family transcriptional regulator [Streptomyces sp. NPDC093093]|uniref:WhiB family transcriptional regulator n=1 Tax=Streptomyces sp. NPDC093093 TaxID=3366025 RepID=UPI003823311D
MIPHPLPPWMDDGLCAQADPELFFPEGRKPNDAAAKMLCFGCVVRRECLAYALRRGEPHGVWGGLNEQERSALLAERAAA